MRSSVQSWPSRQENSQEAGNLFAVRCTKIFPLLVSHFKSNVEEKLALDLGCGPGHSTFFLLERGWKVIAVERNQLSYDALLKAASKTHEQYLKAGKLVVQREDIENYPFDQRFDLIVVNDVFPYLNPKNTLSLMGKIYSALNPGGYLAGTFFQLGGMATFAWSGWGAWFVPSREFVNHVLGKFSYRNVLCRNRPKEGGSAILEFSGQK